MFNRKLKQRVKELEEMVYEINESTLMNHDAIDLLADEMGAEITECDCCGELTLNFD